MSVRTAEELSDSLSADLIWRKKELTILKKLVDAGTPDRKAMLLRSLVALLYAHWEGFIKNASSRYLEYLSNRRLRYNELTSNFVALGYRRRVADAVEQRNLRSLTGIIDLLRSGLDERSRILEEDAISTEANLSSRVLKDITTALGIDYQPFESKAHLIDDRLLRIRNRVAHGDFLLLDEEGAVELAVEVQGMMEIYRNLVENAVHLKSYRHPA